MTAKQKRFCDEYLVDCNATQAAIRAGYSEKTAYSIGVENLKKPELKTYIDEQLAHIHSEKTADAQEVIEYLTAVMRREYKENVVVTLSEEVSTYVPDEKGTPRKQTVKKETSQIVQIPARLCDANKAAELIGRRYGMFKDSVSVGMEPVVLVNDLKE